MQMPHTAAQKALERAKKDKRQYVRNMAHAVLFNVRGEAESKDYLMKKMEKDGGGLHYTVGGYLEEKCKKGFDGDAEFVKAVQDYVKKENN